MNAPLSNPSAGLSDNHRNPRTTQEAGDSPVVPDTGIGRHCGFCGRSGPLAGGLYKVEMGARCGGECDRTSGRYCGDKDRMNIDFVLVLCHTNRAATVVAHRAALTTIANEVRHG